MTLKLNGSSSGYTAIDAPAAAGSNTLTLPADNGSDGEFLKTNGSGVLDWAAAGGKILQIKTLVSAGYQTNPADWTTVISQAVTPTSSTSKIIVIVSTNLTVGATSECQMALYDGTIRRGNREHRNYDDVNQRTCPTMVWVAEGSYTAGTAYTFSFQAKRSGGSNTVEIGNTGGDWRSHMVVLEVDAS